MKLVLCFLLTLFFTLNKGAMPFFQEYIEVCKGEIGITDEEIPKPMRGGPPFDHLPEPSQKMKCFSACLEEKSGILDSSGSLQTDKIPLPPGVTNINFETCKSITHEDKCEKGWMIEKCIIGLLPRPN